MERAGRSLRAANRAIERRRPARARCGLTTTMAFSAGPCLSNASMRCRYASTSARQVSRRSRIAACTSAIVASTTENAGPVPRSVEAAMTPTKHD